jgi:hypothetical protein
LLIHFRTVSGLTEQRRATSPVVNNWVDMVAVTSRSRRPYYPDTEYESQGSFI